MTECVKKTKHLCASLVRAATAVGCSKAEAAGAALGVGRVQVECANSALITARTLDVLLCRGDTQKVRTYIRFRKICTCVLVCVRQLPHLAQTLSCEGVAHFLLGSGLVAVTWPAVGVPIETRSTAVTLAADNVVFTSKKKKRKT